MKPSERAAKMEQYVYENEPKQPEPPEKDWRGLNQAFLDARKRQIEANIKPHMMHRV